MQFPAMPKGMDPSFYKSLRRWCEGYAATASKPSIIPYVDKPTTGSRALVWTLAASTVLNSNELYTSHWINCTVASNLTLPTATEDGWVWLFNEGTQPIAVKNESSVTIGTLPQNTYCLILCIPNGSGVPSWPAGISVIATTTGLTTKESDLETRVSALESAGLYAPSDAQYYTAAASAGLSSEIAIALSSGVYTPTRSAEANLDANVTMTEAQYMRVGSTVTVSGRFTADPTLAATATSFEITLPIASNIGAAEDVAGVAFCGAIAGQGAAIIGVAANDTAKVFWVSGDITSQSWSYTFSYQVL